MEGRTIILFLILFAAVFGAAAMIEFSDIKENHKEIKNMDVIKENMTNQKTIAFDFDGVIHKYSKGWTGETDIYDEPVDGIKDIIDTLKSMGYKIVVMSSRARFLDGLKAIETWLIEHDIEVDLITSQKCPAMCYIDDRAIQFTGNTETLLTDILTFKPWNKPEKPNPTNNDGSLKRTNKIAGEILLSMLRRRD